ncbi:MAG: N-acetylmuramoyl-L-alanine amidase [Rhizobiales bacterium]|nr:N-acetylmuramoyl-L-alanine amidase [Hyphomicrobiales bacterium]
MSETLPSPKPDSPVADRLHPSPNHGPRQGGRNGLERRPDSLILHYTGMADAASALLWLSNPLSKVSCHYFVFEDGRIWQMVPEGRRAWHAGRGSWHGETDMNSASIGIEIAHPGHELGRSFGADGKPEPLAPDVIPNSFPPPGPPYPEAQIEAVIRLVADIKQRWSIADSRILAHSDIAPGRKIDPGENFPWERLAQAGLGLWPHGRAPARVEGPTYRPGDEGMPVAALQSMFASFGYWIEISGVYDQKMIDVVTAFQRHWRQARVDGVADAETLATLAALIKTRG